MLTGKFSMDAMHANTLNWEAKKEEIVNILTYSDIFHYPLTKKEIYERGSIDADELEIHLSDLMDEQKIFLVDGFYSLHKGQELSQFRKACNERAKIYINKARLITKIISRFPYIRGVFLSGSISKNCIDKKGDIDFFIITKAKRLWIAQFFCSMFKRIFLLNSTKYFCYNYMIDDNHLIIDEQSLYTAIEIKTLMPLFGYDYYKRMLDENNWTNNFFPKYPLSIDCDVSKKQSFVQKILEQLFDTNVGEWLDQWLLNYSIRKRRKKLDPNLFSSPNYYTNLQRHVAKSHIHAHYPTIMKEYYQRTHHYRNV